MSDLKLMNQFKTGIVPLNEARGKYKFIRNAIVQLNCEK